MISWVCTHSNHMWANPSKFQVIIMKDGHCNEPVIKFHGQDLAHSECVKLLGIFIDNKLTFHKHIFAIWTWASRQINAMSRVSKFLSKDSKLKLFNAFILSIFLYCSILWHFCSNHDTYKMEKAQKRTLRLVLNNSTSSYLELLEKVNRPPLYVYRTKTIATEIFKCLTDISPNFFKNIFTIGDQPYDLRVASKIIPPLVNSKTFGLKTFRYEGAPVWNKLSETLKNATDVNVFKNYINHWSGLTCRCGNCVICNTYLVWKTVKYHAWFPNILIHCFSFRNVCTDFYPCIWTKFKVIWHFYDITIPYMYTHAHLYIPFFIFQFILSPNSLQGLCYLFVTGAKLNLSYLILSCLVLSSSYHLIIILSSHLISSHLISYHISYQHLLNYTLSVSIYSIILLMHAATIKISSGHTTQ